MNNIKKLIKTYQPSPAAKKAVKQNNILLLVGITGAGKDSIKNELLSTKPYGDIVSHTSRAPRYNNGKYEKNGEDYHFVTKQKIERMLQRQDFIEAKLVHDVVYGSSLRALNKAQDKGLAVTDMDVQGVEEYKLLSPNIKAVFIVPPSFDEWQKRLKKRYKTKANFTEDWPKRRQSAIKELQLALASPHYFFVINQDLAQATTLIDRYAHGQEIVNDDSSARQAAKDILLALTLSKC